MSTLFTDIASLVRTGEAFGHLEVIEDAAMLVEDSKIHGSAKPPRHRLPMKWFHWLVRR